MSVYIKGMEIPKSCEDCILDHKFFKWLGCNKLNLTECLNEGTRHKDCPLISVHDHGRLIDADAIPYKKIMFDDDDFYYGVTQPYIDRMPTIIPADELFGKSEQLEGEEGET